MRQKQISQSTLTALTGKPNNLQRTVQTLFHTYVLKSNYNYIKSSRKGVKVSTGRTWLVSKCTECGMSGGTVNISPGPKGVGFPSRKKMISLAAT